MIIYKNTSVLILHQIGVQQERAQSSINQFRVQIQRKVVVGCIALRYVCVAQVIKQIMNGTCTHAVRKLGLFYFCIFAVALIDQLNNSGSLETKPTSKPFLPPCSEVRMQMYSKYCGSLVHLTRLYSRSFSGVKM